MKRGDITTDLTEIKKIIRNYSKKLYAQRENLDETGKFLEKHKLPKLTQK